MPGLISRVPQALNRVPGPLRWALAGALLTLGFAPFHLWPLGLLALVCWQRGVQQAARRGEAFQLSLAWGLGHGITALYWLPWAFWHDSESWLFAIGGGVPAVLGLALWVAVGYAAVAWLAWPWRRASVGFWLVLGTGVLAIEILRNLTPFGFPWLPLGAMWAGPGAAAPILAQLASVGSVQLLSAILLFLAGLIATARPAAWWAAAALVGLVAGYGSWRVHQPLPASSPEVVRLVQPNLGVQHKWDPTLRWAYLHEVLTAATPPSSTPPALVLLPETGIPFLIDQTPQVQEALTAAFPAPTQLLTGSLRREDDPLTGQPHFFNSLQVVAQGRVQAGYDKQLLVPFGEFIPLRGWLETLPLPTPLRTLSQSRLDFTHGTASPLLPTALGPVVGLICYEGIFPYFVGRHSAGARWLANVTNDAWFTGTTALYQHAALQRLRAIEVGLPLVRSANTGISLLVDPYGREQAVLPPNTAAVAELALPPALPSTLWRRLITRVTK
jgi:apolipoprotein N-acyltransferase